MKSSISAFKNISFSEKSVPFALLFTCLISFGLLIPSLGYYMDDWPYVFYAFNKGADSLREMLYYDSRPNAAWLYQLGFEALGFRPLYWHIAALLLRFTTALLIWNLIKTIWQDRRKEAVYIALLFAVYPFFMLQPFAVGSTHHWFGFITFLSSLLLMVWAVNKSGIESGMLSILSLGFEAVHLFTSEYFSGLEIIRLPVLWILIARTETSVSRKLIRTAFAWLPYAFVLLAFGYWRVAIFENPPGITRNEPVIFFQLFSQPLQTLVHLLTVAVQDIFAILTLGWQRSTDVDLLNFNSRYALFRIAVSLLFWLAAVFYLNRLTLKESEVEDDWKRYSLPVSLLALAAAGLPIWLIGRSIVESKNLLSASRFGLPTTFGAAMVLFLAVEYFVTQRTRNILIVSLLLMLGVNFHIDNTNQFKASWEKQNRLIQELIWRAPQIAPGTAILTDEEILGVMGDYATSFLINTAYEPAGLQNSPPYWFFPFYYTYPDVDSLLEGILVEDSKLSMKFSGNSAQMLLLSFNPEDDRCLWILQPQDSNLRLISEDLRRLSRQSDVSLIGQIEGEEPAPPEQIFEIPMERGWCYYFEKADLARQFQQWAEIPRLWKDAESRGIQAGNGFEYIPFIEGFAQSSDWKQVKMMTTRANKASEGLEPSLCTALDRVLENAPASQNRDATVQELKDELRCVNYQ